MLVDRGKLDLDGPVAAHWPEFGQAGKETLPVRHILSHSAGLPGFDKIIPFEALYDWDRIVDLLGKQEPWWEPGTSTTYEDHTFGFLVGELVRRVTGVSIGTFFRTEVADKIGADFHIGLPEEHHSRTAEPAWAAVNPTDAEPESVIARYRASILPAAGAWASKEYRTAELSANGHGNAHSIARVGSVLAMGGELDGARLLARGTIEKALEEQMSVTDDTTGRSIRRGLGFGLPNEEYPLPHPNSLFCLGYGGSFCIIDLDARMCCAYAMNHMGPDALVNPRNTKIQKALFACMAHM